MSKPSLKLANIRYRAIKILQSRQGFVVIASVLFVAAVVIVRISLLNSRPLDQAAVDDQTASLVPVRFDQTAIRKMQELQDSNVQTPGVQLPQNRQNPFGE